MSQEIISEIFEYKAMFTKNVAQKSKSWNDGRVTYFKINKKIQVHTEDGHLIAEKFLDKPTIRLLEDEERYGESFRVGSVLVYIEELTAKGLRDVARIFKRQRLEPAPINTAAPPPPNRQTLPTITTQRTAVAATKFSSTPLTLSGTVRRRKVGLSRLETPSKMARTVQQQESDDSLSPPEESPSSQDRHKKNHMALRREMGHTVATKLAVASPPTTTHQLSPSTAQPKTPAVIKRSSVSGPMSRLTPSKYTPVPLETRSRTNAQEKTIPGRSRPSSPVEQSPSSQQSNRGEQVAYINSIDLPAIEVTRPSPKYLFSKSRVTESANKKALETVTPSKSASLPPPKKHQIVPRPDQQTTSKEQPSSSLLQKLLEDYEPITSLSNSLHTPVSKSSTPSTTVKTEPSLVQEQEILLPQDSISWGTQDNSSALATRLNTLHQQSLSSPNPLPAPTMSRPSIPTSRTPRPRIGHRTREIIRVEQPTPQRTPPTLPNRTPLQNLQKNTMMRVAHTPAVSLNSKKLQGMRDHGLVTPASVKSKIDVYQSDSDDEIIETQIPKVQSQGRITQTETYNYGGEGRRVSNLRM